MPTAARQRAMSKRSSISWYVWASSRPTTPTWSRRSTSTQCWSMRVGGVSRSWTRSSCRARTRLPSCSREDEWKASGYAARHARRSSRRKQRRNAMRLKEKSAIVIGAGQSPGEGMGNGRATALLFAREGARVLAVDHRLDSAKETAQAIANEGGTCVAVEADVTKEASLKAAVAEAIKLWGRIDVLHNNVGVSLAGGDATPTEITEEAFDL